jgi:L-aspartate oxidase
MAGYHDMAELAPRDVVSRSIVQEMRRTGSHVFLDLTHLDAAFVRRRFPRIYETCLSHGVDITVRPVPVHPAAHYAMGGVATDLDGRVPGLQALYAAGEVACTGVHGANRLASNSLLEGVVFGERAGKALRESRGVTAESGCPPQPVTYPTASEDTIRSIAWEHCAVVRSGEGLLRAIEQLESIHCSADVKADRHEYELRNMHTVALLIARCALAREESRGAHYRTDFPETEAAFQKHSTISAVTGVKFES